MNDMTKICSACLIGLALIIAGPVSCTVKVNSQVVDAIRAGATPLEAACALKGDTTTDGAVCMAAAMERPTDGR